MKLRIHHFYDIIRDLGSGDKIEQHPYLHSYHKIAKLIRENPNLKIQIVICADAVCDGCMHLKSNICDDIINHRTDFASKEEFNNYIDRRILGVCSIKDGDVLTPIDLCKKANLYLKHIQLIYGGNSTEHIKKRKNDVIKGLKYYSKLHGFNLILL